MRALCDRVTIFRDGNKVATDEIADLDRQRHHPPDDRPAAQGIHAQDPRHHRRGRAEGREPDPAGRLLATSASRSGKGEIVGLGGLVGAGRTDVARAIFGIAPAASGTHHRRRQAGRSSATRREAIALGLAFVPEDRAAAGIFRTLSVEENITAAIPQTASRRAASSAARSSRRSPRSRSRKLRIRLASLRQPIGELSGGNQQKAILARWLLTDPSVLILDEPTRGIDIGVKAEFYDMIGELAADGRAILLISSELPELLALCDRVLVMSEGRLTADIPRAEATQEGIMHAAVPRTAQEVAA